MSLPLFSIGIDVGGTNMRAAQISPKGEIIRKTSVTGSRDPSKAVTLIKSLIHEMDGDRAAAIGIGIPGRVDGWTGEIISGGFLNLSGCDLQCEMSATSGRPVTVANDCSMALIGEARVGAARGMNSSVMLTIGTGIGGAVMENGRIVNGRRCAGQLGHLVVNLHGQPCPCGQRGCIETESSGTALQRHLREAGYAPETRFEAILALAESGDKVALQVMTAWAAPLKSAINTLSAAFDPDVVLLGGGMGKAALAALNFLPRSETWYEADIRGARLDDDAGVIGCGLAAFDLLNADHPGKPAHGKRLVMVNGVPASGKSAVSHKIAGETGWQVLSLDEIKNPFLELIDDVDRPFNRLLGRASYKSIFSIIRDAAPGTTFIVDAWFGFQPADVLKEHIAMAGITQIVELWCHAPAKTIGERYRSRLENRLPGHPGASYIPELIELAQRAEPIGLAPVLDIDTTQPKDAKAILDWMVKAFENQGCQKPLT
ncbi:MULTISPECIES: ROK family protein [Rhizobium/Agrobacterium group]|uniref:ROK family protein n=1 Tax=Rhizobium/Agrobacterium group TaxID=227290 RepID=UPI000B403D1F|nr:MULTISPECIES: ROK family protein [Rhizobium/Agrobacterium group]MCF1480973.1 ROK family protein [Allorhizobium ampelinum]NSZ44824.1 ROK family protein [Agrobacterium vitis]NTA28571.1 ROK family protein [Allorhizobium ampelinum]OVE93183.1 transcriptional regulator [Allorhizobium ampelinum]